MKIRKLLVSVISLLILTSCSYFISAPNNSSSETNPSEVINNDKPKEVVTVNVGSNSSAHSNLVEVIEDVRPSVVDINAYSVSFSSAGSGVIVGKSDEAYYVITNHHVIDQATNFEVVVYESEDKSKTYEASLIGTSMENDIAEIGRAHV